MHVARTACLCFVIPAILPGIGCTSPPSWPDLTWVATGRGGMVASPSPLASEAGASILRAGGNAIDAAVATSLAIGVTRPYSSGLGGGGFMMVRLARTDAVIALDYRETAPAAATRDMFTTARAATPDAPPPSRYGGLAVATPGLIAGHAEMLTKYGTRSWANVTEPAHKLAADGFEADAAFVRATRGALHTLAKHPSLTEAGRYLHASFSNKGEPVTVGERVVQPALAAALKRIAAEGPQGFYSGPVAESIVAAVRNTGGILTADDLARYEPRWREPLRMTYRQRYTLFLMPPPSSGGIVIAQTLNFLEPTDLSLIRQVDAPAAAHWFIEAMKHAYADRARWLGDPDAVDVPTERLLDKAYAASLAEQSSTERTQAPERYGSTTIPDDGGTAHFSVVDRWGNVVACTETINTSFGSFVAAEPFGIILNNEMDDFTAEPGKPNAFGLIQSERNAVVPNRRPLSSMSPTIVLRDGKPWLTLGAAGGPRIISSVINVLLSVIDSGAPLPEAMRTRRLHHQWQPDEIVASSPVPEPMADGLRWRGHRIAEQTGAGHLHAIMIEDGWLIGASDPGKGGGPAAVR
ncbi:MAG: gamma-glutamyltransferase [Phycisphaerae bacterium]|nr:gamma-glutamyltransferase [Phycisphaerae bacterium]